MAVGIVLALSLFGLVISKLSSTSHAEPVAAKLAIERPSAAAPASGSAAVVDAAAADPAQPIAEQGDAPPAAVEAASDPLSSSDQDAGAARQELPDRHDAAAPDEDQATQDDDVPPGFSPRDDDAAMDSESLDKTLDKFEALLDDPPPDLSEDSPRDDGEVVSPITHEGGTALPRPTARPIDVAARLRDTIQAIEFSDTPLVEFLEFMSHYSTIPMTLHPESLIWLKISPSSRVSVKTTEKTVSEILSGALRPLGLGFAVLDNQIVVGRPSADGSLRRFTFDVADLVSSEQGAELSSLVVDLVATATWEKNGGRGRIAVVDAALVVEQRDEILFEVLFLLERLRVARGALPLSRFDSRLFQPTDCQRALTGRLSQPVSLNYIRPSSFTAIVDRLGQETKTHMLIDWRSLASVGWTQDTKIPFHVQAKPLREALSILLAPMDLSYRVVGDKLIQISTPMHIHSVVQLESYRVGEMLTELSVEQLTARLQAAVLSVHDGRTATLRLDPVSQCLFVAAAPPIHDTIVEILAGWNRDG